MKISATIRLDSFVTYDLILVEHMKRESESDLQQQPERSWVLCSEW